MVCTLTDEHIVDADDHLKVLPFEQIKPTGDLRAFHVLNFRRLPDLQVLNVTFKSHRFLTHRVYTHCDGICCYNSLYRFRWPERMYQQIPHNRINLSLRPKALLPPL